jgi:hypothetical protein
MQISLQKTNPSGFGMGFWFSFIGKVSFLLVMKHSTFIRIGLGAVLLVHVTLVIWLALHWSPNIDEPAHLAAGMAAWQNGSFEFYCVLPASVKNL